MGFHGNPPCLRTLTVGPWAGPSDAAMEGGPSRNGRDTSNPRVTRVCPACSGLPRGLRGRWGRVTGQAGRCQEESEDSGVG